MVEFVRRSHASISSCSRIGVLVVSATIMAFGLACSSDPTPTTTPEPTLIALATLTPYPTYTPYPTHTALPTQPPAPTYTPLPTQLPAPTYTPLPTQLPAPTYTPLPTYTPIPTKGPTPAPTSTPSPVPRTVINGVEVWNEADLFALLERFNEDPNGVLLQYTGELVAVRGLLSSRQDNIISTYWRYGTPIERSFSVHCRNLKPVIDLLAQIDNLLKSDEDHYVTLSGTVTRYYLNRDSHGH